MTHNHEDKYPVRSIIKAYPICDTDDGESTTSTGLSEDSISGTPTGSTEDSRLIETPVPATFIKSTHDEADSSEAKSMTQFESPQENGEQNIVKDRRNKNSFLSKAQILLVLWSHELLSTFHVTHQSTYFIYIHFIKLNLN